MEFIHNILKIKQEDGDVNDDDGCNLSIEDAKGCDAIPFEFVSDGMASVSHNIKQEQVKVEPAEDQPDYIKHSEVVNDGDKVHQCDICRQHTLTIEHLIAHRYTHTFHTDRYTCLICYKTYDTKIQIYMHINRSHSTVVYDCDICNKAFKDKRYYIEHRYSHTDKSKKQQYDCSICHKQYNLLNSLTRHMHSHTGEKPYECDICYRKFTQKPSLQRHMRTHSGENLQECDICLNKFTTTYSLTVHMRTHSGEKLYVCDVCSKRFTQKGRLKIHMRTHSGEAPYHCGVCRQRFIQKSDLTVHKRTHTGERPYVCDICHHRCNRKYNLTIHKRTHAADKPHESYLLQKIPK